MNTRRLTMNTALGAKLAIILFSMCLIYSYTYAQTNTDMTNKGMMMEKGRAMMEHARTMIESGKVLTNEGDNMMKAGMEMMEGKIGDKGSWTAELNLESRGKMIKDKGDAIW